MDFNLLYNRIKKIIIDPTGMWKDVKEEEKTVNLLRWTFLLPLVILISLCGMAGSLLFSYGGLSILFSLSVAVKYIITFLLAVEVTAWIVSEISVIFTVEKSFVNNYKLVLYSFTPFMICMALTRIFPSLIFINLLGLYGIYISWKGIEILTSISKQYVFRYALLLFMASVVIYLAISYTAGFFLDGLYYAFT